MLLNEDTCQYIKNKIKWHHYSFKWYVEYILELTYIEDYIKNWFRWPYFHWFLLDYLKDEYFEEYIAMVTEIKWWYAWVKTKQLHILKWKYLCTGIDLSHTWDLENYEDIWIKFGWKK